MLLLDSSLFIAWGRQRRNPSLLLGPHLSEGNLVTCGVVRAEVFRGFIVPRLRMELVEIFDVMTEVATTRQIWDRATSLGYTLDRRGKVLPLTDLVIAACALEAGAAVVTHDTHFNEIPGLTVHSSLPPSP